jgi:carbon-monoxide dehydrogenase medium subunit
MYALKYHRAGSLAEAQELVGKSDDAKILAGGQTLIPTLKQRLAQPSDLVDISKLNELSGVTMSSDTVTIGAGTKHAEVASNADIAKAIPALAYLAGLIGDPHVRHMGTLGGSIANNDPAADYPAALVGLGATVHTTKRSISAEDFFVDMFETALEDTEIVTKVDFPIPERAAYEKFPNPASRYAMVGVFVAKSSAGVKVAVTGAAPCVFRSSDMEAALAASFNAAAIENIKVAADDLNGDLHGSAEYRAHLVSVMAQRAVAKA